MRGVEGGAAAEAAHALVHLVRVRVRVRVTQLLGLHALVHLVHKEEDRCGLKVGAGHDELEELLAVRLSARPRVLKHHLVPVVDGAEEQHAVSLLEVCDPVFPLGELASDLAESTHRPSGAKG